MQKISGEGKRTLVAAPHGKSCSSIEVRDERNFPSVVSALTRKRIPTKVAVKIEPGEIEKPMERLGESGKFEVSGSRLCPEDSTSANDHRS